MLVAGRLFRWAKDTAPEVRDKLLQRRNFRLGLLPYALLHEFLDLDVAVFWAAWVIWHLLDHQRYHLS